MADERLVSELRCAIRIKHTLAFEDIVGFSHTPSVSDPTQTFRISKILIIIGLYPEEIWSLRYNIENYMVRSYY